MSVRLDSGRRKSRLRIPDDANEAGTAVVLPSGMGCILGPEAEACFKGRTTITLEQYRAGSISR